MKLQGEDHQCRYGVWTVLLSSWTLLSSPGPSSQRIDPLRPSCFRFATLPSWAISKTWRCSRMWAWTSRPAVFLRSPMASVSPWKMARWMWCLPPRTGGAIPRLAFKIFNSILYAPDLKGIFPTVRARSQGSVPYRTRPISRVYPILYAPDFKGLSHAVRTRFQGSTPCCTRPISRVDSLVVLVNIHRPGSKVFRTVQSDLLIKIKIDWLIDWFYEKSLHFFFFWGLDCNSAPRGAGNAMSGGFGFHLALAGEGSVDSQVKAMTSEWLSSLFETNKRKK